ncbi:hypothetical protein M406DRAFT_69546 [Cryphonectria parasitica EP155]|uniref:Extracellular mutant protein 11 C-terminal domain-containing protein n=1 Tax=Cryphonectria parasitica (strain ATCC 38755 / EP155) TaxID=660469 RepID=A0A9P4Y6K7_CRYP1|nr:uncharacterized protein M406DRAFT_69546 [Cryphonectria parasitica EP155]KAF3767399.1 hypothetical protein M406DRAFT_69546 [Cryphonectria parasitica EP155]
MSKHARSENGGVGTPQFRDSASRPQDEYFGTRPGWESAPPTSSEAEVERDENAGGLRELWEEQSNVHSLFSESLPTRPVSVQDDGDNDDTRSDILVDRPPPRRRRRSHHRASESAPFIGRYKDGKTDPGSIPYFTVKNGLLGVGKLDSKGLSTSMITHPPRNTMPDTPHFRQDPFATTSEETSSQPERGGDFLHSSFPYRGSEAAKGLTHVERAVYHMDAAKKLSPEKYDGMTDAIHPQIFAKPDRIHSISDQRPTVGHRPNILQSIEDGPASDSDADESDGPLQENEFGQHRPTTKKLKQKVVPNDATVVFNPQKPMVPPKPSKTVVMQDEVLQASPMSRFIGQHSSKKKRHRDIDYDDAVLEKMSFADLQNEPFDHDPTKQAVQSPAKPPADNLDEMLQFYRDKSEGAQTQFFTQMSVRDWEDSGDWFLEQFGDIMKRMKQARQDKRKMVEHFETEISNREEAVRCKKESIDRKLSKLRHDGKAMMEGKELND